MRIKAIMLTESLGNHPTPGFRVGEEAVSIEPINLDGVACFKVVLDRSRNYGLGFGDWLVMPTGVKYVEIMTPEEEASAIKAEKEAKGKK